MSAHVTQPVAAGQSPALHLGTQRSTASITASITASKHQRRIESRSGSRRLAVFVYAADPISQAGAAAQLRGRPEVHVVEGSCLDDADVALVVADQIDEEVARAIRGIQRDGCPRVVVVLTAVTETSLMDAIDAGASGLVRRSEASPERLSAAIVATSNGDGALAPDLVGRLINQVKSDRSDGRPRSARSALGLADRELDTLRLLAEGLSTREIAFEMSYSERTIKNILSGITTRLGLRNRTHAVAHAFREGVL